MTSGGDRAGTRTAYQTEASYPGSPDSANVGRSGKTSLRLALVTPSPLNRPARTWGIEDSTLLNASSMCPPIKSVKTGPAPLYGTCTISMRAAELSISPARWVTIPMPAEPKLSCLGRAFASAIRSFTDRTGTEGCANIRKGAVANNETGEKSFTGSYGSFWYKLGLMVSALLLPMNIV